MTLLLSANTITLTRQEKTILDAVSLDIHDNDFITIIGPNGAGKTMLLKCLMGIVAVDKGDIFRRDNLRIGYVPQYLHADYAMPITARQFIVLHNKKYAANLTRISDEIELAPFLDKKLHHLSGGQLQRTLLARALLQEPDILMLDEPAQNLDITGQLLFYNLLERIHIERHMPIIMVSHDLHMVMASTRKVVCLYHHICCSGTPSNITQDPEFAKLFGDDMVKIMGVYHHSHNHDHNHDHDPNGTQHKHEHCKHD